MKTMLPLICAAAGLCAAAAPVVELSPAAWRGAKVERLQRAVLVKDAGGKPLLEISAEPRERIDGVTVTVADDHVSIDANKAFKAGMGKLVCMTAPADVPEFAGEALMYEVRVAGPEARPVTCGIVSWKEDAEAKRQFHYEACNGRKPYQLIAQSRPRTCRGMVFMPERTGGYRIRFDFTQGGGMPFAFYGGSLRLFSESQLPPDLQPASGPRQLMFHAPFDGSPKAAFAKGNPSPVRAEGVTFAPGLKGQALRVSPQAKSMLQYAFAGNAIPEHGAVSLWFRSERPADGAPIHGMGLFATDYPFNGRSGTGSLYLWRWGDRIVRGDMSNDADLYATRKCDLDDGKWHHAVLNWDRAVGVSLWVDGYFTPAIGGGTKSVDLAIAATSYSASDIEGLFDRFCVGAWRGGAQFHGLIDDLRIYSAPLGKEQVDSLRREIGLPPVGHPDYAALSAARGRANPYVAPPQAKAGTPGRLELVREWRFDRLPPAPGFKSFGKMSVRSLGGVPYIEAGDEENDRFRMTFDVDTKVPFLILEFDYPDDRKRTMDIIVQDATGYFWDYTLQVGVLTGGDAPVSGKMRTHRCIYWTRTEKVGLVAMTARKGGAAALAAFRVLKPVDGALPEARIVEPRRKDGWGRTMAIYYEDAAINYDFSVPTQGYSPESALEMADRLVAVMKFTGQNLFAYPGAWYEGPIDERYNPRDHAPDFLSAFYERFDAAGLGVMPLINQHRMADADPAWLTAAGLLSGAVHQTPVSEGASGFPQSNGTMGPALYNIAHPLMRKYYSDMIDRFIRQGARHPSFRGVGIHLKYPSLTWFGTIDGGYNDYCIEAFEKATGVHVPVGRASPRRSREYATWLKANAYEKWVQWRCDVCTGFWVEMARKLAAARPDLKLWINDITPLDPHMEGFRDRDYMRRTAREGGMDRERLAREAPNVILGQTTLPADYRFTEGRRPGFYFATPADREHQRTMHLMPEFWDFVKGCSYAIAHQHDRYWEAPTGNPVRNTVSGAAISGPDFDEHDWRVSTLNPPGRYALQHFAQALLHQDMLGLSKGGYLVGTYGMEEHLAPFAQAFRALPPVMMETLPGGGEAVRLRFVRYDGRSWFYLVNTSAETVRVKVTFPPGTSDLVTDEKFSGALELELAPYELRSFGSASGRPSVGEDRLSEMQRPWEAPIRRLSLDEYEAALRGFAAKHPGKAQLELRGKTIRGLNLWLLKCTDRSVPDDDKNVIFVSTLHSGFERTGTAGVMAFAEWLLGGSPEAEESLRKNVVLLMPNNNPEATYITGNHANSAAVDPYSAGRGALIDLETLRPKEPAKCPEILAFDAVSDEYAPDINVDVHGVWMNFNGHIQPATVGRAGSNSSILAWDDSIDQLMLRASERAGFCAGRPDADCERILWGPCMGARWKSFCDIGQPYYYTATYGYLRNHTMLSCIEATWTETVVEPLKAMVLQANKGFSCGPIKDFRVNRIRGELELYVTACGRTKAERRKSRVKLWRNQRFFSTGSSYPATANWTAGAIVYGGKAYADFIGGAKDGSGWANVRYSDLLARLDKFPYIDRSGLERFLSVHPPEADHFLIHRGAFENGEAAPDAESGMAVLVRLPMANADILHVSLNGRVVGHADDPCKGYLSWNENGYTCVSVTVPRGSFAKEPVQIAGVAWNPPTGQHPHYGWLPGKDLLAAADATASAECEHRTRKDAKN